jgi:hypothetical protein
MRFTIHDMDISINVSLSGLLYDSKAVCSISLADMMSFLREGTYSSVFKSLDAFDCGGRTIMEDWVRHVSVHEHNYATYSYTNKNYIMTQLQTDYSSKLVTKSASIPSVLSTLRSELYANRRCSFAVGDMLLYRTTISPYVSSTIPSKRYLMQVIITS